MIIAEVRKGMTIRFPGETRTVEIRRIIPCDRSHSLMVHLAQESRVTRREYMPGKFVPHTTYSLEICVHADQECELVK